MLTPKLRYFNEIGDVVEIRETMSAEEALQLLVDELLGPDYYIVDPVGAKQANVIMVRDILKMYKPMAKKAKRRWFG